MGPGAEAFKHLQWSEMANDVVAVADDAGFKKAVLCGMSMGSAAAMWTAMLPHTRERVAGLVIIRPPDAWHGREKATCILRRLIQTHASFAALLAQAGRPSTIIVHTHTTYSLALYSNEARLMRMRVCFLPGGERKIQTSFIKARVTVV